MTVGLSLPDDYLVFDGLESVTLRRFVPGTDTTEDVVLPGCVLRRPVKFGGAKRAGTSDGGESQGRYEKSTVTWYIPQVVVATQPELGSNVIDSDGQQWTITDVMRALIHNQWKCTSVNLAIRGGLTSVITIQRATISKGVQGQHVLTWSDWQTGVAARVQKNSINVNTADNRRESVGSYTVYIGLRLNYDTFTKWRIKHESNYYSVINVRKPQEIDELTEIYCDDSMSPI